jgi:ubiquinone/menaquinone biosynthesis C-methylase UbiE
VSEPQNIYDDAQFFAGYSQLERFGAGWQRAMEHVDLLGLIGDPSGRRVLDLGCGTGQLAHHLAAQGALEVLATDVSERMIELARAEYAHPHATFRRAAMEDLEFPAARFDLIVSSLAVHYVADYLGLMRNISTWLTPDGALVYSTEHPIFTARLPEDGWLVDEHGQRTRWTLDRYAEEDARAETWFVEGVRKHHRRLSTLINGILDAGLQLERILEPAPSDTWLATHPDSIDERRRPMFLLVKARKP